MIEIALVVILLLIWWTANATYKNHKLIRIIMATQGSEAFQLKAIRGQIGEVSKQIKNSIK